MRLWIIKLVAFLMMIWPYPVQGASTRKIVIAHGAMNARVGPLWIARDRGFFTAYGVDTETLLVRGAPTLVAAMTAGDIDIGYTGGPPIVTAAATGSDLKDSLRVH